MFAVAELDGHLDLKSKYIYTNGMLVGRIDENNELFQYFHDGLGSITMIVDSTGSYQNLYTYDDFGDFRHKSENVSNSYCYTGQERDENPSGLYNLRARYYAAGMGRFTQEDPVLNVSGGSSSGGCTGCSGGSLSGFPSGSPERLNAYVYVSNNPVNYIDPMGLYCTKTEALLEMNEMRKAYRKCLREKPYGFGPIEALTCSCTRGRYGASCVDIAEWAIKCVEGKTHSRCCGMSEVTLGKIHEFIKVECQYEHCGEIKSETRYGDPYWRF